MQRSLPFGEVWRGFMNEIYNKLTTLDFAIVAIYLIALLAIGYIASFRNKKKDETLFMAGNSLNWYLGSMRPVSHNLPLGHHPP